MAQAVNVRLVSRVFFFYKIKTSILNIIVYFLFFFLFTIFNNLFIVKKYIIFFLRGYSLTGKTTILHIVISGSSPDNSNNTMLSLVLINIYRYFMIILNISSRSSIGRANHWSWLGCKFKSYLEQVNGYAEIGNQVPLRTE